MKALVRIFNIIYLAICAVACVTIFTSPILSFSGTITLSKDQVVNLIKDPIKDQLTEQEIRDSLDFDGKDDINFDIKISLPSSLALKYKDEENTSNILHDQLAPLIDGTVTKLNKSIEKMAEVIVKKNAKGPLKNSLTTQIQNRKGSNVTDEDLDNWGITDEYIEDFVGEVFDIIVDGGGTVEDLIDVVSEKIDEVCSTLKDAGVEGFEEYDSEKNYEMTEEIKSGIVNALKDAGFCDEDGNLICIEDYICNILDEQEEGGSSPEPSKKLVLKSKFNAEKTDEEKKEEARQRLTEKVTEVLTNKAKEMELPKKISQYGYFGIIVLVVLALPWIAFAIITLIRTLRRRKIWTKPWSAFTFAFTNLVLGVVLTIASTKLLPVIVKAIPEGAIKDILSVLQVSVKTSTFVASILYLAMIPLTILYVIFVHSAKRKMLAESK